MFIYYGDAQNFIDAFQALKQSPSAEIPASPTDIRPRQKKSKGLSKCQNAALVLSSIKRLFYHRLSTGGDIDIRRFFIGLYIVTETESGYYKIDKHWQKFTGGGHGLWKILDSFGVVPPEEAWTEVKRIAGRYKTLRLRAKIGRILSLTQEERAQARAWNIIPIDKSASKLKQEREARKHAARNISRQKARIGKRIPLSQSKPWEAEGISRRTWFRRKRAGVTA
jgi:hypothetical protein